MEKYHLYVLGSRGSRPVSGANYQEFGGATSCYLLKADDHAIVLDCGSGLYEARSQLKDCKQIDVLLTHVHYDHVLGLLDWSVFEGARLRFYAGVDKYSKDYNPQDFLKKPFWPVSPEGEEGAKAFFVSFDSTVILNERTKVRFAAANHPDGAAILRVDIDSDTEDADALCLVCDWEHGGPVELSEEMTNNCSLLLYDGMYTELEYPSCRGWGHSTWQEGVKLAAERGVPRLVITHHHPCRSDRELRVMETYAAQTFSNIRFARVGDVYAMGIPEMRQAQAAADTPCTDGVMAELCRNIRSNAAADDAIAAALETVVRAVQAQAGTFWFYHRFEDGRIRPMAVCGEAELADIYLLPGEGIAGQVIDTGESMILQDCQRDERWTHKVDAETGFVTRTMICVPLETAGLVFGSIQIINKSTGLPFDGDDLSLVEGLADTISRLLRGHPLLAEYSSYKASEKSLLKENETRRAIFDRISTYMDPAILHEILRTDGQHKKSLATENMVVLFADIRGFTQLTEKLNAAQLISLLSDFLALTSRNIHQLGGIVDKFMGDCTMAYWRLDDEPEALRLAADAALAIQADMQVLAMHVRRQTGLEIGIGIGLHTGPALRCHVGDERYMAYTIIGDVVNVASRLKDKAPTGCIYLSREVAQELQGAVRMSAVKAPLTLKGKRDPFAVWTLDGPESSGGK